MIIYLIRSIILYGLLIAVIRLLGKRQLGQMEASEFVVSLLIADLASVPMQELGIPLLSGIIPIITVLILELTLSALSYHSIRLRKIMCGKPVILMKDGNIIQENLKRTRITPDELTELLREKEIVDLSSVKYAILETNGQISALQNPADLPLTAKDAAIKTKELELPITLISNGKILEHNLHLSGHDDAWLVNFMKQNKCKKQEIYLLTIDSDNKTYLSRKQKNS